MVGLHLEQMAGMQVNSVIKSLRKKEHVLDFSGSAGHRYHWRVLVTVVMNILDVRKTSNLRTSDVKYSSKRYSKQRGKKVTKGENAVFL